MRLRNPGVPDEPSDNGTPVANGPAGTVSFSVPTRVIVAKLGLAVLLALISLLAANRPQLVVGLAAAVAVAIYALRDVLARERLNADPDGVVATHGYARRRRLAWADIERVRVDGRSRLGARSEMLELDAGEEIFLYSRFDLGVDPDVALRALEAVRGGQNPSTGT